MHTDSLIFSQKLSFHSDTVIWEEKVEWKRWYLHTHKLSKNSNNLSNKFYLPLIMIIKFWHTTSLLGETLRFSIFLLRQQPLMTLYLTYAYNQI